MRRGAVVVALLIAGLVAPVHSAAAATSAVSGTGVLARPDTPPGEVRQAKAKAPTLRAVRPSKGAFTGGQKITLKGKRLSGATKVTFGSRAAKILSRRSTTVVVRAPLGVLGKVPVRVRTRHGTTPRGAASFTYTKVKRQRSTTLTPAARTFVASSVTWVTGGYNPETGTTTAWTVALPRGTAAPVVGQKFVLRPGNAARPSGLVGSVSAVAEQLDESVRVTVNPVSIDKVAKRVKIRYAGPVVAPGIAGRAAEAGQAAKFSISGPAALGCKNKDGASVSVSPEVTMTVTDVDVDQRLDLGSLVRKPSYDGSMTAEIRTTGKITAAGAATCKLPTAWRNAHRKVIPLGTSGMTLSFAPTLEFTISAKGTWSGQTRTRTTFSVNAEYGHAPRYSRAARMVESRQSGEASFEAEIAGGVQIQLGLLDRAGVQGKVEMGVTAAVKSDRENVCVDAEVFGKFAIGVFLDAWITRWEADAFTAKLSIGFLHECVVAVAPVPAGEPGITSTRLPDAPLGEAYEATLTTQDNRPGTWSIVSGLPPGLSLDPGSGRISGTPTGAVQDYAVVVDFKDGSGRVATATVRVMVVPPRGISGGDIQATLRWAGAADLDLHVIDPSGEEIYYSHSSSASGGSLDHDANAGCNGIEDDDNPVENIFWPTGKAPGGTYLVLVKVYRTCAASLDWHLTVRRNGTPVVDTDGSGDSEPFSVRLG